MTPNLPERIGTNAGVATEAARLRAAAAAATQRIGHPAATPGADRHDRQSVYRPVRTSHLRPAEDIELHRESRDRSAASSERRGPNPLFLAQHFAQESAGVAANPVDHARGTAAYPSLAFENEIFLPGEEIVFVDTAPRVDFIV